MTRPLGRVVEADIVDLANDNGSKSLVAGQEQGTAFDATRLFGTWQDGRVFDFGQWQVRDVEDMLRRDGKAATLEQVLTLPLRSASFTIEPAKGDKGEAEAITDALTRPANAGGMSTPLELIVGQMTYACVVRKAFFEKVFAERDGRLVYDKVAWRPPATCYLARDQQTGAFAGFRQQVPAQNPHRDKSGYVTIEPRYAMVYIHGQHRDPLEGTSELMVAYQAYTTKQKLRFLWYSFLENQALPKAKASDSQDDGRLPELVSLAAKLKNAGVIGLKQGQDLQPFESNGRGGEQFKLALDYLDHEMSGSVLAAFTDLPSAGSRGSYALSKDQTDMFLQSRQAIAREMAACINNFLIADLVSYNFPQGAAVPTFTFGPLAPESVETSMTLLGQLITADHVNVPREFVDELTERVASFLDLDVDVIHKAIVEAQKAAPPAGVPQMAAATGVATAAVQSAQAGGTGDPGKDPRVVAYMQQLRAAGVGGGNSGA